MNIKEQFPSTSSNWVRYSRYEITIADSRARILPVKDAQALIYNPLESAVEMLVDALNLGRLYRRDLADIEPGILEFVSQYGLLGLCADLPYNPNFLSSGSPIALRENSYLIPQTVSLSEYLDLFFPKDFMLSANGSLGDVTHRGGLYNQIFSSAYSEPLQWYKTEFAAMHRACSDMLEKEEPKALVYPLNSLQYTLTTELHPKINWAFPSLRSVMNMALALCISEPTPVLRVCKNCGKIYYNANNRSEFCSTRCRNQYNVREFRKRAQAE